MYMYLYLKFIRYGLFWDRASTFVLDLYFPIIQILVSDNAV